MDLLLLAQAQTEFTWVAPLLQLATSGGFTALLWYFVTVVIPAKDKAHATERAEWLEYIKARDAKYELLLDRCITCVEIANAKR